jgi:hypothetical protein
MKKVSLSYKLVEGSHNSEGQFVQHGPKLEEETLTFYNESDLLAWISKSRETQFKYIEVSTVFFSRNQCSDGRAFDELTVLSRFLPR